MVKGAASAVMVLLTGAFHIRENPPNTAFRRFYERGDLPIAVDHKSFKNAIKWKVRLSDAAAPGLQKAWRTLKKLQELLEVTPPAYSMYGASWGCLPVYTFPG
jgi:hypothetical protein